jgi:hypothetical protein
LPIESQDPQPHITHEYSSLKQTTSINKRGYDVLVFVPPDTTIESRKTVTLYRGVWHELLQDKHKQPFLGQPRPDIHDHDGPVEEPDDDD